MVILLTVIHVLVAVVLIMIVLLQSGKGTGIASAFGGMGSQAAFGPRGTATFLSKATIALATVFMITSLTLSIMASRGSLGGDSLLSGEETAPAPAAAQPPGSAPGTNAPASSTPGVQVQGMEGVGVNVTVEDPSAPPTPAQPSGSETTGSQPAPAPAQGAASGQ